MSHFGHFHSQYGVSVVGEIKRGLPAPSVPSFDHAEQLLARAITIAAVSLSISISMAKMLSRKHAHKVSSNQVCLTARVPKRWKYRTLGAARLRDGQCCVIVLSMLSQRWLAESLGSAGRQWGEDRPGRWIFFANLGRSSTRTDAALSIVTNGLSGGDHHRQPQRHVLAIQRFPPLLPRQRARMCKVVNAISRRH